MDSIKSIIDKFLFPALLVVVGLITTVIGISGGQSKLFTFGGVALVLVGGVSIVYILDLIKGILNWVVLGVLVLVSIIFALLDYSAIREPMKLQVEQDKRNPVIIQRLKDIRTAQIAYKSKYNKFANNFDSLLNFVQNEKLMQVQAFGELPDSMIGKEKEAIELGIIRRDTFYVDVEEHIFLSKDAQKKRAFPYYFDSIPFIPFTNKKFKLEAGTIDKGSQKVPVFEATDIAPFYNPYSREEPLKVGSMTEIHTNGNWPGKE